MSRKITSTGEATYAQCRCCDWIFHTGTSRVIRKAANRHAGKNRHRVEIDYDTVVTVDCRDAVKTASRSPGPATRQGQSPRVVGPGERDGTDFETEK